MNKLQLLAILVLAFVLCSVGINKKKQYKDGVFTGESRSKYNHEPYWGQATIEIKDDKIISMTFKIVDKEKNEVFGPDYEQHYKDIPTYIQQCRNEVKGIQAYSEKYLKTKDIDKVDAISGATWSYNFFRDAINITLEQARNK